jgi:branched-chain amino acid aminotransferase
MEKRMSFEGVKKVWMSGALVDWTSATVHVSAHSLHLGSGVFEAIRCYETARGPALFRLDAHLERLFRSAAIHGMKIPYSAEELDRATCATVAENGFDECYVRMLAYYGTGGLGVFPRGCPVEVAILAWPMGAYLGAGATQNGIRSTITSWVKFESRMMPTTAKASGQYINSLLAVRDAFDRGYDEAILLNANGEIAEGSGENIFVVKGGKLFTNDEHASILLGITREAVIRIARDLGYEVVITKLRVDDLLSADEAFFTGTAAEVTPIREIDGKNIPPGPITKKLQDTYVAAIRGRAPEYASWLRCVSAS